MSGGGDGGRPTGPETGPEADTLWLRTTAVELGVLPDRGGRIASLRDRRTGREWLLQPEPPLRPLDYGGVFTEGDMAGWDEMVPTILACASPEAGAPDLPDHGEAWAVPWEVEEIGRAHHRMSVVGRATGYRLTRTIEVAGAASFALHYELERTGPTPAALLWAAHPQFAWHPGDRVVLDPTIREVVDVTVGGDPAIPWDPDLASWLDDAADGTSRKVWLFPDARPGAAGIVGPAGTLSLTWSAAEIPYLGVWFDAGEYASERVVALEPSTGYRDDLAFAAANGTVPILDAGQRQRWSLVLHLEPGSVGPTAARPG